MAGWSGKGQKLDPGRYLCGIRDVKLTVGKEYQGDGEVEQFEFHCDIQLPSGEWKSHRIWTKRNFMDPAEVAKKPSFTPGLMKLVRACGLPWPTNEAEARAWVPTCLVGKQFILASVADEETGALTTKYLPMQAQAAQFAPTPAPAPARTPKPAPAAPRQQPAAGDPFADEVTYTPALVGAGAVTAAADGWA